MSNQEYVLINRFKCAGKLMVTIRLGNVVHVMPEAEWKWIYGISHPEKWRNKKQNSNVA